MAEARNPSRFAVSFRRRARHRAAVCADEGAPVQPPSGELAAEFEVLSARFGECLAKFLALVAEALFEPGDLSGQRDPRDNSSMMSAGSIRRLTPDAGSAERLPL